MKLINADWQRGAGQKLQADLGQGKTLSMPLSCPDDKHEFPLVEGMTDKYVGWMKVRYQAVMCDMYTDARDKNWWVNSYCRPPRVLNDDY